MQQFIDSYDFTGKKAIVRVKIDQLGGFKFQEAIRKPFPSLLFSLLRCSLKLHFHTEITAIGNDCGIFDSFN